MLYGAPEVPGQEKEPVQRVAQLVLYRVYRLEIQLVLLVFSTQLCEQLPL